MECPVCKSKAAVVRQSIPFGSRLLHYGSCPECHAALRAVTGGAVDYAWDIRAEQRAADYLAPLRECPDILYLPPGLDETAVRRAWRAFLRQYGRAGGVAAYAAYAELQPQASRGIAPLALLPPAWFPDTPSLLAERLLLSALPGKCHRPNLCESLTDMEVFHAG